MTEQEIEDLWRSPRNQPAPEQVAAQSAALIARMRGRHRAFVVTITLGLLALGGCAAAFVNHLLAGGRLDPGREWGGLLFLALPLIGAAVLLRQYRRHRARHAAYQLSINAGLRAALDENRLERTRIKVLLGLYAAMVLLFPIVVTQLLAVGKARPSEVASMLVLFAVLVGAVALALLYHDRRRLLPRRRELEALLAAYEGG